MLSRRKLLHAGCTVVAVTLAPHFLDQARAWMPHGISGTPKIKVNTGFVDGATFKNFMASFANVQSSGGYAFPSVLNADQYPVGTIAAVIQGQAQLPSNLSSATTCVFAWTGTVSGGAFGSMGISNGSPGFTVTVGSSFVVGATTSNLLVSGTNGYIEFNWNGAIPSGLSFSFQSGATFTGLTGLIICAKSDYASIISATNAGQLISPTYVSAMKALAPVAVRTMQWGAADDGNNFTQHKYRMNWQTALCYSGSAWLPNCWAGSSGGTNAYTCSNATDSPGVYTMGEVLQLQFINPSTTGALTMNRNGLGNVPMFDMLGNALTGTAVAANALATLIYDDLLVGYLVTFAGLTCNVPVETQIGLANQVGCGLYYNLAPHIVYASCTSIAALIGSTLAGNCYVEYANEVWNFAGGFQQTPWAVNCGAALGFPNNNGRQYHSFYALRVAQIMPLVTAAWSGSHRLKCVLAFQAFGVTGTGGSTNVYRMQGADLSTSLGYTKYNSYVAANFNAFPNRPVDVIDSAAYANYCSGAQCANFSANYSNVGGTGLTTGGPASGPGSAISGLTGAADALASGDTANAIAWLIWDITQGTNNGTAGAQTLLAFKSGANSGAGIYPPWETVIKSYDGVRPSGKANISTDLYEGNPCECAPPTTAMCTATGINTAYGGPGGKIDNLITAMKSSAAFAALLTQWANDFFAAGTADGRVQTANFFAFSNNSQWSGYEPPGDVYSTAWQSLAAIAAYNHTP